jgi:hypothetical protein
MGFTVLLIHSLSVRTLQCVCKQQSSHATVGSMHAAISPQFALICINQLPLNSSPQLSCVAGRMLLSSRLSAADTAAWLHLVMLWRGYGQSQKHLHEMSLAELQDKSHLLPWLQAHACSQDLQRLYAQGMENEECQQGISIEHLIQRTLQLRRQLLEWAEDCVCQAHVGVQSQIRKILSELTDDEKGHSTIPHFFVVLVYGHACNRLLSASCVL